MMHEDELTENMSSINLVALGVFTDTCASDEDATDFDAGTCCDDSKSESVESVMINAWWINLIKENIFYY